MRARLSPSLRCLTPGRITVALLFAAGLLLTVASAQKAKTTAWDGVYTSEQANRGQDVYDKRCAECHQDDLAGGGDESAAPLRGPEFFARWNDKSLADIYRKIEESMPKTAHGSLGPRATVDVIAFLLKKNQFPASDAELPPDHDRLESIVISDKPR